MSSKKFYNDESSDSDDLKEIFSSSSYDRSSIGSIPWAEDAIKQNQQEWDHIERMFYGEEELPQENDLKNEILEWRQIFPHLRINGTKIKISKFKYNPNQIRLLENYEEIFSAHPLHTITNTTNNENNKINDDFNKEISATEFDKNLRIKSVPIVLRNRAVLTRNQSVQDNIKDTEYNKSSLLNVIKTGSKQSLSQVKSVFFPNLTEKSSLTTSNSASTFRMPSIMNVITIPHSNYFTHPPPPIKYNNNSSLLSSKPKSGKSILILPTIDLYKITSSSSSDKQNCRSISAAVSNRKFNSDYILQQQPQQPQKYSAPKFKKISDNEI